MSLFGQKEPKTENEAIDLFFTHKPVLGREIERKWFHNSLAVFFIHF